jgi:hypothetical protein
MKTIYTAVIERLKNNVPALKWIDLDAGQLEYYETRPAVAFPCAIINVDLPNCADLNDYGDIQQCTALVTVRIVQNRPDPVTREPTLPHFDLIEQVYKALQCFEVESSPLSRVRQGKENRPDAYFVYRIDFQTSVFDKSAEGEYEDR